MSFFVTYDAENYEYILKTPGYVALVIIMVLFLIIAGTVSKKITAGGTAASGSDATGNTAGSGIGTQRFSAKQLSFCAISIALAIVTSFIKFASLPMGGSITLFSMFFVCFVGYLYGAKVGLTTGIAYGILQLILGPYIYNPIQLLLDYPLAFGALGLSGFFRNTKHGLQIGLVVGMLGRYIMHVISGYVFFAAYAPEGMNPLVYTLGYNATYILPEMIATIIIVSLPPVTNALNQVKNMANN